MRGMMLDDRLEAVAGPPAGHLGSPGTVSLSGFGALEDRILYAIVDVTNNDAAYAIIAYLGGTTTQGRMQVSTGNAGQTNLGARLDTASGDSNATIYQNGARTPGRHIIWAQTVAGMTGAELAVDSANALGSRALTPGGGMPTAPSLVMYAANPSQTPLAAIAYRGSHDEQTRVRVTGWLARRYSIPILGGGRNLKPSRCSRRARRRDYVRAA